MSNRRGIKASLAVLFALLVVVMATALLAQVGTTFPMSPRNLRRAEGRSPDHAFYPGDYSQSAVIGQSLPGTWRPFTTTSPWNTPIPANAATHPASAAILSGMIANVPNVRFARAYSIPVWIVNSDNIPLVPVRSDMIYDTWDVDRNGWSDIGVPLTQDMWWEQTTDGHICIIDPFKKLSYEMSKFGRLPDGTPTCTTFNVWEIDGTGVGNPYEGRRWHARGGRGSGFPIIAGLVRPEEIEAGEIRHALVFSYETNRRADDGSDIFMWPPACRADGAYVGENYPIEGMRFQLDPSLTEQDFDAWGLNRDGKVVARALQRYGMFLSDNGGSFAMFPQLLRPTGEENLAEWERRLPGFFRNVEKIPTSRLRIVHTVEPTIKM
jgi:hypothetical protein